MKEQLYIITYYNVINLDCARSLTEKCNELRLQLLQYFFWLSYTLTYFQLSLFGSWIMEAPSGHIFFFSSSCARFTKLCAQFSKCANEIAHF